MSETQKIMLWNRFEDGELGTPMVEDYASEYERNTLVNPDELAIKEDKITIEFSYPLSVKVYFKFEKEGGFTNMDLLRFVYEGYKKIYDEEEEEVGDPGIYDKLYNRKPSHGKYGIWGHYMNDLYLEIINYNPEKRLCTLDIGS
ncbi:hypothetical protein ES703_52835 [subsurface metagenome]